MARLCRVPCTTWQRRRYIAGIGPVFQRAPGKNHKSRNRLTVRKKLCRPERYEE